MPRSRSDNKRLALLSERLVEAREWAGYESLDDVAYDSGVPAHTIRSYERGRFVPSALNLANLAEIYGVRVDWLLGLSKTRKASKS
jgi:transcriptional regulator with XRE-family HTH domain